MSDIRSSGSVTITFDDAHLCQYELGYKALRQFRVPGVVYVPTAFVGTWFEGERVMDLEQLRELAGAGWEIGSHTVSHPHLARGGRTALPPAALEAELRESREWLLLKGFSVVSFAYPYGDYNAESAAVARKYYRYARTCERGLNEYTSANVRLARFNLCHGRMARWISAVDSALARKQWLVAMIHRVVESAQEIPAGKESLYITGQELSESLAYIRERGLPVRTIQEAAEMCGDLPESYSAAPVSAPAVVPSRIIRVAIGSEGSRILVQDAETGYKLKFEHHSTDRISIISAINRRTALDIPLSLAEIGALAEFDNGPASQTDPT